MRPAFNYVRLAIIVSSCFIVSFAQGTDQGLVNRAATRLTEQMKSELSLTADQVPKVQQANLSAAQQFAQVIAKHKQKPGDTTGFATEAIAIANSRESQLKQVLTQAQFEKYESKRPERAAAHSDAPNDFATISDGSADSAGGTNQPSGSHEDVRNAYGR